MTRTDVFLARVGGGGGGGDGESSDEIVMLSGLTGVLLVFFVFGGEYTAGNGR